MTWTKLSDDYDVQCAGLSDAAYRTHNQGLIWCMRRETDGAIVKRDVARFADTADPYAAVDELVAKGFWEACDNGYLVRHHMEHQVESTVMATRRKADAERQRRKRHKAAGLDGPDPSRRESRSESRRDDPRDPGRVWSGLVGKPQTQPGQEEKRGPGENSDWPGIIIDDLPCEFCGAHGPTLVDEFGRSVCVGRCVQEPS